MVESIHSFIHMLSLPQPLYEEYCKDKRLERYEKYGGRVRCLGAHAVAHRVLIPLMRASLTMDGKHLKIIRDARRKTIKPVIFCPTHIGGVDIEMSFLAVKQPCWVVIGDPHELYKSLDGMMLQMNGWIPMEVMCKEDRTAAKAQMTDLLKKGGNLLLFPEGVQNISPNALVGNLYAGAVDLAITCGAEIVPVALARDENDYYCIIGKNIDFSSCKYEERFELTKKLRDEMASLKWEIIEQMKPLSRRELVEDSYDEFVHAIITMNTEYSLTVDDIRMEQFRPKGVTEPEEAFRFLAELVPSKRNAFLFRGNIGRMAKKSGDGGI